jgi:hypothetical protein
MLANGIMLPEALVVGQAGDRADGRVARAVDRLVADDQAARDFVVVRHAVADRRREVEAREIVDAAIASRFRFSWL